MSNNPFDAFDDQPAEALTEGPRPSLWERFSINAEAGFRLGTTSGAAMDYMVQSPAYVRNSRAAFDARYQEFPDWVGPLEGAAALAGQIVGSVPAVENFIPFSQTLRLAPQSKHAQSALSNRIFAGAFDAATGNAIANVGIQSLEMAGDLREGFSGQELLLDTVLGAGLGAGFGTVAVLADRAGLGVRGQEDGAGNPFDAFDGAAAPEARAAPATVRDPAIDDLPAGELDGQTVTILDDQSGAPDGMVIVRDSAGTVRPIGRNLVAETPAPVPNAEPVALGNGQSAVPDAEPVALPDRPVPDAEPVALGDQLADRAALANGLPTASERAEFETRQRARLLRRNMPAGRRPAQPMGIRAAIAAKGGIRDMSGELAARDLSRDFAPGQGALVRPAGASLDDMRMQLAEDGFFHDLYSNRDEAVERVTIDDLLNAIERDRAGDRVFSQDQIDLADANDSFRALSEQRDALDAMMRDVQEAVDGLPDARPLDDEILWRAADLAATDGMDPLLAIETAVYEDYRVVAQALAERGEGLNDAAEFQDIDWSRFEPEAGPRAGEDAGGTGEQLRSGAGRPDAQGRGQSRDAGAAQGQSEQTQVGDQRLISGVAPVTDADRLARRAEQPMRGGATEPGGLFDEGNTRQSDLADFLAAPRVRPDASRERTAGGRAVNETPEVQRVREIGERLARALDVAAVRKGRINRARALGIYKSPSGVIRVRSMEDFDVLTHEYGHHVERAVPGVRALMERHRTELTPLAYDGANKKHLLEEGFAEFFRLWITNRSHARKRAPVFADAFDTLLADTPDIRSAVDEATEAWTAWLNAPSQVAVASTIVSGRRTGAMAQRARETASAAETDGWMAAVSGTIADVLQRLYTFNLDDLNPLENAVGRLADLHRQNTGRTLELNVTRDPYKMARMSRGAYHAGHMDVMHGVAPYRQLNPATPSLRDAIILAMGKPNVLSKWDEGRARAFGAYLWSRRALGEWQRFDAGDIPNPPDKLTRGDHQVNVKELEAANPQFVKAADMVHAFARGLWQKKFDAGLIDRQTFDAGLDLVDYVPGLRDFSADTPARPGKRAGSAKSGFVRRFMGSKRDVINPLESLAADAYETANAIARNDVIKQLDRLALLAGEGAGAIAERIPSHEIRATMVDPLEAVETAAREAGFSKPDIVAMRDALEGTIGDENVAIYRPAMINEKGEPIVFFRDGGQLVALRLADGQFGLDLYKALTTMSRTEQNFWIELLAVPARVVRAGITTSLDFIGANFIRDQTMAWLYYGKPLRRVARSLQGAGDDLLGSDTARRYARVYGISGGQEVASQNQVLLQRDLAKLKAKGWVAQRLTSWRGVLQVAEVAETATRVGLFRTFADEARARGLDEFEATMEASWRARDYIDFDRRGSGMAGLARVTPFLNVALQGLDKTGRHAIMPFAKKVLGEPLTAADRAAMGEAVKTVARLAMLITGSVALYAWQSRNEDHDEVSEYTRATHWMVKAGAKWLAIPKPFEFATAINLAEAAFDAMARKDALAMDRWQTSWTHTLLPPMAGASNPLVNYYFERRSNTKFFTGAPIVPEHMRGMEPALQYTAWTSEFAKDLGTAFNVSPALVDHAVTSFFASWGRSALALYDMAQPDAPATGWDDAAVVRRFVKDAANGAQSSRQFWSMMSRTTGTMTGAWASWRAMMDGGDPAAAADFYARQNDRTKAFIAVSTMDADTRRLHPLNRAHDAVAVVNKLRRDLASDVPVTDATGAPVTLGSAARTAMDDVLATLAMAIARNSLAAIGEPGWVQRAPIDEAGFYREVEAISAAHALVLADRMTTAKVYDGETVHALWPELERRLMADGSDALSIDLVAEMKAAGMAAGPGIRLRRPDRPQLTRP